MFIDGYSRRGRITLKQEVSKEIICKDDAISANKQVTEELIPGYPVNSLLPKIPFSQI